MASAEKIVSIVFQGDDRVSKTIQGISTSMSSLGGVIEGIADPLAQVGDGVLKADAALAALAVGGMALALRESGKFGTGFNEISTLIEASAGDLDSFREAVVEYGKDSTSSLEDINAAVYTAISAGIDYRDAIEAVARSERLAVAGKADLESTTRVLASTLNAYGESTDQAARYSDVLFQTVKMGQTTLPELAASLSQVTGVAAGAKIPIETLTAAIAAVTATGAPTSQAITQIRSAIANIIKPSSEAAEMAAKLGIEFDASALQSKGFEGVLREVYEATDGNVDIMAKMFGSVEGLNAAMVLGADSSGKFKGALEAMRDSAGVVDAAFQKMAENFDLVNQKLANNFRLMLVTIGDNLQEGYADVAGGATAMIRAVSDAVDSGAFAPLFDAFDDFAAKAGDTMRVIAENLPEALEMIDWSGIIQAVQDLAGEFGAVFDGVDLGTAEGLAKMIQSVVDTIESLVRVTQGMVVYLKPVWETIREGVSRFNELGDASKKGAGEFVAVAMMIVNAGAAIAGALVIIQKSGADIERVFNVVIGAIQLLWGGAKATFAGLVVALAEYLDKFFAFAEYLSNFPGLGKFKDDIQDIRKTLQETSEEWQDTLIDAGNTAAAGLSNIFSPVEKEAQKATDSVKAVGQALGSSFSDAKRTVSDDLAAISDEIEASLPKERSLAIVVDETAKQESVEAIEEISKAVEDSVELSSKIMEEVTKRYQSMLEYNLGVLEEQGKTARAMAESVAKSFGSSQDALGGMIGEYGDLVAEGKGTQWIRDYIAEQMDVARDLADAQIKNLDAQTRLTNVKADRAEEGEAIIHIDGGTLQPHLEAFMYEILEAIQIRATEEGASFLLGT